MLDRNILLVGYSGHALAVADTAFDNNLNIIGYTEKSISIFNPFNLEYFGDESNPNFRGWGLDVDFIMGIGDNYLRGQIYNLLIQNGQNIISVVSSSSSISKYSKIGHGVFINRNVSVNAFANIGNNVILNTGCIIEHECIICDHVHIAPGAVLAGNVEIGNQTFIGANSVIKQGVKIGKQVVVGAGTVVLNDVPDGKKLVGNPNRYI